MKTMGAQIQTKEMMIPSNSLKRSFTIMLLITIICLSGWKVEFSITSLIIGLPNMVDLIVELFPPDLSYVNNVTQPMLDTIRMAVLGTTFGAILSIPIALCSARNVATLPIISIPARFILNLVRTIPDLLLAAFFVAVFGIGALPGIFALMIFSVGIIAKLTYEAIESIDPGPLEAMTAVGANKIIWIAYGVVPQIISQFMSFILYTFEVNVRAAAVLGLVGAGGIGLYYERTLGFFEYEKTSTIILYTLIVVLVIDYLSTKIRERLI